MPFSFPWWLYTPYPFAILNRMTPNPGDALQNLTDVLGGLVDEMRALREFLTSESPNYDDENETEPDV